jgi:transitional endoplasmic reticulum ATPase
MIRRNVVDCYDDDEGRSICRVDPDSLLEIGLSPGDTVCVSGDSDAYAEVWRSDRTDWNENQILLDEILRYNAQAEIGDTVTVEKAALDPIEKIKLLPYRGAGIEFGSGAVEALKKQKIETPVRIGSVLAIATSNSETRLLLVVTGPQQIDPGVITESTTIEIPDSFLSDSHSE